MYFLYAPNLRQRKDAEGDIEETEKEREERRERKGRGVISRIAMHIDVRPHHGQVQC